MERFSTTRSDRSRNESVASAAGLVPIIFGAEPLDQSAITHCLNDGCL